MGRWTSKFTLIATCDVDLVGESNKPVSSRDMIQDARLEPRLLGIYERNERNDRE